MGYESRIFVVERREYNMPEKRVYGSEIAKFNLGKMYGPVSSDIGCFTELFKTPIDFDLYETGEAESKEDRYGEICKYTTDIDSVIRWLEAVKDNNYYRRSFLFLDFCKSLATRLGDYEEVCLVHFGY